MRIRIFTLLLVMGTGSAGIAGASPEFESLVKLGQESLAKADLAGAALLYEKACENPGRGILAPRERASCEHHLAIIDEASGNYVQSEKRLLKALDDWQRAGQDYRPSYAMSLINLGELYRRWRRLPEAEQKLVRAVDLTRELRAAYPQTYAEALSRLAGLFAESQNTERARPLLEEAIAIFRAQSPREDAELSVALDTLGMIDLVAGRHAEAESLIADALRLSIAASGENHPETATRQSDLALAFIQDRQFGRAVPLLNRARFILESRTPPDDARLWTIYSMLSVVDCSRGRFSLAEEHAKQAISILSRVPSPDPARLDLARVNLAVVYLRAKRPREADAILPAAVEDERREVPGTALLADGVRELADLRSLQHRWGEAQGLYREALDIYRRLLGPNSPSLAPILRAYAESLRRGGGSKTEARAAEAQMKTILGDRAPA
ncbi:MAG: tetratricopeptide repeat protein [Acidobacteriota bacterium]|nr:tetratricopeptide repeat protein [Acidobacteriota bacterium]